jgi:hypothetical protein
MHTTFDLDTHEVLVSWHGFVKFYDNKLLQTRTVSTPGKIIVVFRMDEPVASYTIEEATDGSFKYDDNNDTIYHELVAFNTPEFWYRLAETLKKFIHVHEPEWPQSLVRSFDPLADLLGKEGSHSGPRKYYDKEGNLVDLMKLRELA